jgi:hypothetical protein
MCVSSVVGNTSKRFCQLLAQQGAWKNTWQNLANLVKQTEGLSSQRITLIKKEGKEKNIVTSMGLTHLVSIL